MFSKEYYERLAAESGCCLEAQFGEIDKDGYRRITVGDRRIRVHRFVWLLCFGEIPEGKIVRHKCDNPPCVNPFHLLLGTNEDNVSDRQQRQRHSYGEGHYAAKITERTAKAIIVALQEDSSQTAIARSFGVSKWLVNDIKIGKSWKHLSR